MTINSTSTSVTVQGTGLTTTYSYTFYMGGSSTYAQLTFIDSLSAETVIATGSFSITGVTVSTGGTFTYPLAGTPITAGEQLRLNRVLPYVQSAAVGNQGNFYPSVVEGALDNLEMQIQQIAGASGTINAESLFGNPSTTAGAGRSIAIGSGLSFSGTTLVVSGVSGSGTVTQVNTGTGLSGGPITGVGTITLSTITTGMVLANYSGATAAPQGVTITAGTGITLSSTTTSLTIATVAAGLTFITSSTASLVTFSSITNSYTHLLVLASGRSTLGTSPGVNVQLRFNTDTGSTYDYISMQIQNATPGGNTAAAQTSAIFGFIPHSTSTALNAGSNMAFILNYKNTGLYKTIWGGGGAAGNTSADATWVARGGYGQWRSTASITTVEVIMSVGVWSTGSLVSLYGLA